MTTKSTSPRLGRRTLLGMLAAPLVVRDGPARAQAPDFAGRTIEYIVGNEPGGGYDNYARLIAPFFAKHLPGSRVVVLNRPSGGGVVALNAFARAPGDGGAVMTFNTGLLMAQLAKREGLEVDLRDLTWIGKASSEARVLVVRRGIGIESFEELIGAGRELVFVASGFGGAAHIQTNLMRNVFALPARLLLGFGGSEAEAALVKGEIDGALVSESNVPALIEAGAVLALLRFGTPSEPAVLAVPAASGFATTDEQRLVVRRIEIMSSLGRLTAAPPATAVPIAEALRSAYAAALSDPDLVAAAARSKMPLDPLDGAAVQIMVDEFLEPNPRFEELLAAAIAP